ncbi:hypothetical protein BX600DRAFT_429564 [Xylariales sp. PMI_506]|nr:hypothetical protein BX600DRAFT_429564 [Xylariales sp. PMI_506]
MAETLRGQTYTVYKENHTPGIVWTDEGDDQDHAYRRDRGIRTDEAHGGWSEYGGMPGDGTPEIMVHNLDQFSGITSTVRFLECFLGTGKVKTFALDKKRRKLLIVPETQEIAEALMRLSNWTDFGPKVGVRYSLLYQTWLRQKNCGDEATKRMGAVSDDASAEEEDKTWLRRYNKDLAAI